MTFYGKKRSHNKGMSNVIAAYKLEEDCIALFRSGLTRPQIVKELNDRVKILSGDMPPAREINLYALDNFLKALPGVGAELIAEDRGRLLNVVASSIDLIDEVNSLFLRSKTLLEAMEAKAEGEDKYVNPYQYKAVASEMREMLKQMIDVQREINDYANIKKFMEVILTTLKEEVPEQIPTIIKKLRAMKDTQWFSDFLKK